MMTTTFDADGGSCCNDDDDNHDGGGNNSNDGGDDVTHSSFSRICLVSRRSHKLGMISLKKSATMSMLPLSLRSIVIGLPYLDSEYTSVST